MKLKNNIIISLVNAGLLNTTEHDVPAADAYKVYKFRKAVGKALDDIAEKERGLEAEEDEEKREALRQELFNDESDLGDIKSISFESYHILSNENKKTAVRIPTDEKETDGTPKYTQVSFDTYRLCEDILDGVLFRAPEE